MLLLSLFMNSVVPLATVAAMFMELGVVAGVYSLVAYVLLTGHHPVIELGLWGGMAGVAFAHGGLWSAWLAMATLGLNVVFLGVLVVVGVRMVYAGRRYPAPWNLHR